MGSPLWWKAIRAVTVLDANACTTRLDDELAPVRAREEARDGDSELLRHGWHERRTVAFFLDGEAVLAAHHPDVGALLLSVHRSLPCWRWVLRRGSDRRRRRRRCDRGCCGRRRRGGRCRCCWRCGCYRRGCRRRRRLLRQTDAFL